MTAHEMTYGEAEVIALDGLRFLAKAPERLENFMSLTGLTLEDLQSRAGERTVLGAVLEHLMADESLLHLACEEIGISPGESGAALRALSGSPGISVS